MAEETKRKKRHRGFENMSREKLLEVTSRGGKAAQHKGTAHTWTGPEARQIAREVAARRKLKRERSKSAERVIDAVTHGE